MEFKKENMPKHIAIIMDGNRRWAKAQGKPAGFGHKAGAKTLENIVRYANKIGLEHITVYAFSTENWKRAEDEVKALMMLLQSYLDDYSKRADSENIKVKILGDITALSQRMQKSIINCMERTKDNTGIIFNIALNYGGRLEIIKEVSLLSVSGVGLYHNPDISAKIFEALYDRGIDIHLISRGEMKILATIDSDRIDEAYKAVSKGLESL